MREGSHDRSDPGRVRCGVIARILIPFDVIRNMHGPKSWGFSILIGMAGAVLGWLIFTVGLGIGDDDIFDWGGILMSFIGALIILMLVNWYVRAKKILT